MFVNALRGERACLGGGGANAFPARRAILNPFCPASALSAWSDSAMLSHPSLRLIVLVIGLIGFTAGCGPQIEPLTGVDLVAVPTIPTPTPFPTETPEPGIALPHTSKAFLDVMIDFAYPTDWAASEGLQYALVYDPSNDLHFPRIGAVITRASSLAQADPATAASRELLLYWDRNGGRWIFHTELWPNLVQEAPDSMRMMTLAWGGRPSAVRSVTMNYRPAFNEDPIPIVQFQIALRINDDRDLLTLIAMTREGEVDALEPILAEVLDSLTVNGASLPAGQMLAAVEAL
jgi:hypothetical protein